MGWTDERTDSHQPPGTAGYNPPHFPSTFTERWDGQNSSLAAELGKGSFGELSPKVTRSVPWLPKKEKFSDRFSARGPTRGRVCPSSRFPVRWVTRQSK